MKKTIQIIFVLFCIILSDNGIIYGNERFTDFGQNAANVIVDTTNISQLHIEKVLCDSITVDSTFIIDNVTYSVLVRQRPGDNVIRYDSANWVDNYIEVKVRNNSQVVFSSELSKKDFAELIQDIYEKSILHFLGIENIDMNGFVLSFSVCVPDSDYCYFFKYLINLNGETRIIEEDVEEDDF